MEGGTGMTLREAIEARHSVRAYREDPIPEDVRTRLDECASECSRKGNVHIFIRYDDPDGFDSRLAHYGHFRNVKNYIVLAGAKGKDFDRRCGYWGEKLVLEAQRLGLNTCWAALTFNRKKVKELLFPEERLCMVIALGYGTTQGVPHKGKKYADVTDAADAPDWFREGVEAALLAPTAVNQQKFLFSCADGEATVRVAGRFGSCLRTDLGIVQYYFEAASGHGARAL